MINEKKISNIASITLIKNSNRIRNNKSINIILIDKKQLLIILITTIVLKIT